MQRLSPVRVGENAVDSSASSCGGEKSVVWLEGQLHVISEIGRERSLAEQLDE